MHGQFVACGVNGFKIRSIGVDDASQQVGARDGVRILTGSAAQKRIQQDSKPSADHFGIVLVDIIRCMAHREQHVSDLLDLLQLQIFKDVCSMHCGCKGGCSV
jgi:hypothetical protein